MSITTLFISGDGVTYLLDSPTYKDKVILQEEAYGMPPIEYVTQRGPFQHGETLVDYFLQPRVMQLLVRHKYCSHSEYWDGRAALLDILRPNRAPVGTFGVIRKILPSGQKRDISVMIQEGPGFVPHRSGWDEWAYEEALRFVAHNPVWFDPTLNTNVTTIPIVPTISNLVFPITFPIVFGVDVFTVGTTTPLNYYGNWEEYPTIRITGPIDDVSISNLTTGEKIALTYSLPVGYTIIITLTYSNKTIMRNDGINLLPYITTDSSLTTFHLKPATSVGVPMVNNIVITGNSAGPTTAIAVDWYNRYIGV